MSTLPGSTLRATLRIFTKSVILVFVLNFVCVATGANPIDSITRLNTFQLMGHGRARLAYQAEFKNGQLPFESLIATHEIAFIPKKDEYRVIILGNSGPWGAGVLDRDTLSAQLNALHLRMGSKPLTAYNLGYPAADVISSTLILDSVVQYHPDLVIWLVTGDSFNNTPSSDYQPLILNRSHLDQLVARYGMTDWLQKHIVPEPQWRSWLGFRDQGTLGAWITSLLYPFVPAETPLAGKWDLASVVTSKPNNFEDMPGIAVMPNDAWQFLSIGQDIVRHAGAQFLLVNQPTVVLSNTPYSAQSYSRLYGREFYDRYRAVFSSYCEAHHFWCYDLWNSVPPDYFTDAEVHMSRQGWTIVANKLAQMLQSTTF